MPKTPFPSRPCDVVALSALEFTRELDLEGPALVDAVCHRFLDDANRAVVWLIRFRALTAWAERAEIADWLRLDPSHTQRACEVAASFDLNDDWGFDTGPFRSAVESVPPRSGGQA